MEIFEQPYCLAQPSITNPCGTIFEILYIKQKLYLLRVSTRGEFRIKTETKLYLLRVSTRGEYRIKTETK